MLPEIKEEKTEDNLAGKAVHALRAGARGRAWKGADGGPHTRARAPCYTCYSWQADGVYPVDVG